MTTIGMRRNRLLRSRRQKAPAVPGPTEISRTACRFSESLVIAAWNLPRRELAARTRKSAPVAFARQVAMYLAHIVFGISMSEIGKAFGRDRTTVAHACRHIEDKRDDPHFETVLLCLEIALRTWNGYAGIFPQEPRP